VEGLAIIKDVLTAAESANALDRLWQASHESERRCISAHIAGLDPNASNVRERWHASHSWQSPIPHSQ